MDCFKTFFPPTSKEMSKTVKKTQMENEITFFLISKNKLQYT